MGFYNRSWLPHYGTYHDSELTGTYVYDAYIYVQALAATPGDYDVESVRGTELA